MTSGQEFDDEYVANMLKKDAESNSIKFSALGLQSLTSTRSRNAAPKPNTRFLRNILRETEGHNAALLAKEQREARERQRQLVTGRETESSRNNVRKRSGDRDDARAKRRRVDESDEGEDRRSRSHRDHWRRRSRSRSPRRSHREKEQVERERSSRRRHHGSYDSETSHERSHHDRHRHRKERRRSVDEHRPSRRDRDVPARHRHKSPSRSPPRSPSQTRAKHHRSHRSPSHTGRDHRTPTTKPDSAAHKDTKRQSKATSSASDSDPLESILGPLPPPTPHIRSRGRGTFTTSHSNPNSNSAAMDAHFSANYDATTDIHADALSASDEDDWDQALEALRDRQKWKAQGAERLRAAGFSEEEVRKWEVSGRGVGGQREKGEGDVRWKGKGEGREWDRGKVLEGEGVEVRAVWGK